MTVWIDGALATEEAVQDLVYGTVATNYHDETGVLFD
jgi:hypothetical protein